MLMLRRIWKDKLFFNIMRMVLLVLIPSAALGVYTCFQTQQSTIRSAEERVKQQLINAAAKTDQLLENVYSLYSILDADRDILYIRLDDTATAENMTRLTNAQNLLRKVYASNESIQDIFLYSGNRKIVSSSGVYPADYYLNDYRRLDGYDEDGWKQLAAATHKITYLKPAVLHAKSIDRYYEINVIPVVKTFYLINGKSLMVFLLNADSLLDQIRSFIPYPNVSCSIENPQYIIAADPAPADESCIEFSYTSLESGWTYRLQIPSTEMGHESTAFLLHVLLTVISMLVLGLILALSVGRNLYQPLRSIQNMLESNSESSASSLAQLEKQVARLSEHSSDAHAQLIMLARNCAEDALLSQSLTEKKAVLLQTLMSRHLGFHQGPYQCVAVRFAQPVSEAEEQVRDVFSRYLPTCSISYNENIILLIIESDTVHTHAVVEAAVCEFFRRMPNVVNGITVGCEVALCQDLYRSFNTSLTIMQRIEHDQRDVLLFADNFDIANQYVYTHKDEWALIECLQRNEGDRLHHLLDSILLNNYEKCVSYQQMLQLFEHLRSTAYRYAQQIHQQLPPHLYRRAPSLDAMREETYSLFSALLNQEAMPGNNAHSLLAEAADVYMAEHYAEDIYLETIAEALEVSAKHLSKVYKQQRGINLTDQLAFIRVEQAKELLQTTDMTIADVMASTGFISRATFLRIFKKYTDISPKVYRQMVNHSPDLPAEE